MEKGPSRRCHPSYKHSLGQPLSLRFVNNKGQRAAAILVDPYDGDVFFVSSKVGFFDLHDKKGSLVGLWYPEWTKIEYPPFVGKFMENKNRSFGELFIMQPSAEMSTHSRNEHKRSRQCPCVIL